MEMLAYAHAIDVVPYERSTPLRATRVDAVSRFFVLFEELLAEHPNYLLELPCFACKFKGLWSLLADIQCTEIGAEEFGYLRYSLTFGVKEQERLYIYPHVQDTVTVSLDERTYERVRQEIFELKLALMAIVDDIENHEGAPAPEEPLDLTPYRTEFYQRYETPEKQKKLFLCELFGGIV